MCQSHGWPFRPHTTPRCVRRLGKHILLWTQPQKGGQLTAVWLFAFNARERPSSPGDNQDNHGSLCRRRRKLVSPLLRGDASTAGHSAGLQAKGRCLCASSPISPLCGLSPHLYILRPGAPHPVPTCPFQVYFQNNNYCFCSSSYFSVRARLEPAQLSPKASGWHQRSHMKPSLFQMHSSPQSSNYWSWFWSRKQWCVWIPGRWLNGNVHIWSPLTYKLPWMAIWQLPQQ